MADDFEDVKIVGDSEEEFEISSDESSSRETEETDYKSEYQRLVRENQELNRNLSDYNSSRQTASPQPPVQREDPYQQQEESLWDKQKLLATEYQTKAENNTLTREDADRYEKEARKINMELYSIAARRVNQQQAPLVAQQQQQAIYRARYSDVQNHPQAIRYAKGVYDMLVAEGHPENDDTIDKAMNRARSEARFGLKRQGVSNSVKNKFTATGSGGNMRQNSGNSFKFDKDTTRMAYEMFLDECDGDEVKAKKMYVKQIGAKAQKEMNKLGISY